ncbi:MAG: ComEC/Rec2 family competence protein [Bacillota bacterium]
MGALISLMETLLSLIGQIPGSSVTVSSPSWLAIGFYYLLMIAVREYWLHRSEPRWVVGLSRWKKELVLVLMAAVLILYLNSGVTRQLRVVFLDVGEGDAIFIQAPGNYTALIDGGGKAGDRVVLPFLRREGIRKLDLVVSSHPDTDHLQGLFSVVKEMPVAQVIMAPVPEPPGDYRDFIVLLENRKVNYSAASNGLVIKLGPGVQLDVLNPSNIVRTESGGDNNNSVVMKLVCGDTSVLLTGDIEHEAMQELVTQGGDLRSTVIKMPHHGSKSGLEPNFLHKVTPKAVVISVGKNSFGHPSPEILNFWEEAGVPTYRTDMLGAVTFTSDGHKWSINGLLEQGLPKQNAGISGNNVDYAW